MTSPSSDTRFSGTVPKAYETYIVPLLFEPYAADLADRVAALAPASVLEIAAGTGVVTRAMASRLPVAVPIVATDLNPPMLAEAAALGTSRPVEWRPADAMALPFGDATYDAVVCQFGVMFFPDKPKAFSETRRVLRPGGTFPSMPGPACETTSSPTSCRARSHRSFPRIRRGSWSACPTAITSAGGSNGTSLWPG